MTDRKPSPKRLLLLAALAVSVLVSGGVTGRLLAPRAAWNPNLPGQVHLAAERMLAAPAVRYRGSLNDGLVSFDVTMTEHGEGYGVARKSGVMVELMLVDGVTLVKGNDAYWDRQSEDAVRFTDVWVRASPAVSTYVDLTALTPTAVKEAVTSATRGDVQLRVADWGWTDDSAMTFAAAGDGTTMYLRSASRLTQVTGRFGQLGSGVQFDVTPVDHATAMTTYNLLVQVAQKHPGYIDPDLRLTVVRHSVAGSCGPTSCQVRVTARNGQQRAVSPRLEVLFFADSAYARYISGCVSPLPAVAPGATVTGACTARDAQWQRWIYVEQPRAVYYTIFLIPHVTSANPPRQPTP